MKKLLFLSLVCLSFTSCSLFKVYAGKVEYTDTQRKLTLSADSVFVTNQKQQQSIKLYIKNENSTYRPFAR